AFPSDKPRIVGYAAKWDERAMEYAGTPRKFDFEDADAPLLDWLRTLAVECFRLFDLAGYARVDFRVDSRGQPWILEINANPCLSPDAGFAAALLRADLPFARAVEWIVDDALRQKGEEASAAGNQVLSAQYSVPGTSQPAPSRAAKKSRRSPGIKLRTRVAK